MTLMLLERAYIRVPRQTGGLQNSFSLKVRNFIREGRHDPDQIQSKNSPFPPRVPFHSAPIHSCLLSDVSFWWEWESELMMFSRPRIVYLRSEMRMNVLP